MLEVSGKEIRVEGRLIRIAHLDGEGYQFLDDPEAALGVIRDSGTRVDVFTFIQKVSDTSPQYSYPMEWDNMAVLPVSSFDEWMKRQIDFKVRNRVRKAAKNGVVVREVPFDDTLLRGISSIYNESPIRQGRRFWHYGKNLEALRRMKATFIDRSIFIGAFFENNLIGFAKLVTEEHRSQAGLMHILSMIQHRDKAPTNALIAQAVRSCADRGVSYLWYANFSYGKKQRDALSEFKRHNGFQKVEVPRYYVPLTVAGRTALRLGLHRSSNNWVPEPAAATYRRIRALWYAKRFQSPKETT
ncbi:MAG TPA: hypothetical protein VNE63_18100 [Candidatus Acidoferrales bacterium]|nr:hypothetical protein [Candidatus Acidoferrales bacterium]